MNVWWGRSLTGVAVAIVVGWLGWALYEKFVIDRQPGDLTLAAAHSAFGDGDYANAISQFSEALTMRPNDVEALIGLGTSHRMQGDLAAALTALNRAVTEAPELSVAYANRGIVRDLLGEHAAALADYDTAIALDAEAEALSGPGFITRFLRNQPEPPPSVQDRAEYLRAQLALPPSERVLLDEQEDGAQRPYKVDERELRPEPRSGS